MKRLIAPLLLAFSLTAASAPALAQDGGAAVSEAATAAPVETAPAPVETAPAVATEPNAVMQLTDYAFSVLQVVLVLLVCWGVGKGVKAFEAKTGIEISDTIEARIDELAEQGIGWAVEKSHKKVKEGAAKLTGPEKMEAAADFVLSFAKAKGWDDWGRDAIEKKIEAKLGKGRKS